MMADGNPGHQPDRPGRHDVRQALYNDCATGPAFEIQLPLAQITRLHGFVVDVDPGTLEPGNPIFPPADDAEVFYRQSRPVLDRHPIFRHSTVRATGNGLHLIVNLTEPLEFRTDGQQRLWDERVRLIQASVPSDPAAAGLPRLTRPVGAVNTKNGREVRDLKAGTPIAPAVIESFANELVQRPFRTMAGILLGADREISPCPSCRDAGSALAVLDLVGICYGCGKVGGRVLLGLAARREPVGTSLAPAAAPTPKGRVRRRKGVRHA